MAIPEHLLDEVKRLDPLPITAQRLLTMLTQENASINQIVNTIQYDPAVASNILKVANSPAYAGRLQVAHLRDAVVRLGVNNLLNIVLGGHIKNLKVPAPLYGLTENDLWLHATAASLAVKAIIKETRNGNVPAHAAIAALVHDIGKLIIVRYLQADVSAIWQLCRDKGLPFVEAEYELFACDHTEVGAAMARKWSFPEAISRVIELHHRVPCKEPSLLLDAVMVANLVAKSIGAGLGGEGLNLRVEEACRKRLGLTVSSLERVCAQTAVWLEEVRHAYEGRGNW